MQIKALISTSQGPSGSCSSKTIFRELSSEAKSAILEKHNELRRNVAKGEETGQPAASNMKKLVRTQQSTLTGRPTRHKDTIHSVFLVL